MKIDTQLFGSSIFIDFRYQSIDYYRLKSITIDFIGYRISSIELTKMFASHRTSSANVANRVLLGSGWKNEALMSVES